MTGVTEHFGTAGAAKYVDVDGYAMLLGQPDTLFTVVLLAPSVNTHLTGIRSLPFAAV